MSNLYVFDQLNDLKLLGMANDFQMQIQNPSMNEFPFEQRLRSLIDHEKMYRDKTTSNFTQESKAKNFCLN